MENVRVKSGATRTSNNPFEASKSEKPQYFVDVVPWRTNGLKTIILSSSSGDVTFLTPFGSTWPLSACHFCVSWKILQSCVICVQTDLYGSLLDTTVTMIDLMSQWCGLNKHFKSSWKRSRKRTHTHTHTHTHYLLTHWLTHPYTHFPWASHTNTLELLLHLQHLIPCPSLPTINHVDKRSLLITVLLISTGVDALRYRLLIKTLALPFLVDKSISLSTRSPNGLTLVGGWVGQMSRHVYVRLRAPSLGDVTVTVYGEARREMM